LAGRTVLAWTTQKASDPLQVPPVSGLRKPSIWGRLCLADRMGLAVARKKMPDPLEVPM